MTDTEVTERPLVIETGAGQELDNSTAAENTRDEVTATDVVLEPYSRRGNKQQPRAYNCTSCSRCFDSRRELVTHQYMHRENPTTFCATCNKSFSSEMTYRRHAASHNRKSNRHVAARKTCSQCDMQFDSMRQLSAHHAAKHVDEKRFVCAICGSQFAWPENLRAHQRTHELDPHECDVCGRRFVDATSLRVHTRNSHGPSSETPTPRKQHSCKVCGRSFQFDFSLRAHMKGHAQSPVAASMRHLKQYLTKSTEPAVPAPQTKYVHVDSHGVIDLGMDMANPSSQPSEIIVEVYNYQSNAAGEDSGGALDFSDVLDQSSLVTTADQSSQPPVDNNTSKLVWYLKPDEMDHQRGAEKEQCHNNGVNDENLKSMTASASDEQNDQVPSHATTTIAADAASKDVSDVAVEPNDDEVMTTDDEDEQTTECRDDNQTLPLQLEKMSTDEPTSGQEAELNSRQILVPSSVPAELEVGRPGPASGNVPSPVSVSDTVTVVEPVPTLGQVPVPTSVPDLAVTGLVPSLGHLAVPTTVPAPLGVAGQILTLGQAPVPTSVLATVAGQLPTLGQVPVPVTVSTSLAIAGPVAGLLPSTLPFPTPTLVPPAQEGVPVSVPGLASHGTGADHIEEDSTEDGDGIEWMELEPQRRRAAPFIFRQAVTRQRMSRPREPYLFNCIMTDEKPFICVTCGQCFRWEISLNIHHRIHTDGTFPNKSRGTGRLTTQKTNKSRRQGKMKQKSPPKIKTKVKSKSGKKAAVARSRIVTHRTSSDEDDDEFTFHVHADGPSEVTMSYRRQATRGRGRGGSGRGRSAVTVVKSSGEIKQQSSHPERCNGQNSEKNISSRLLLRGLFCQHCDRVITDPAAFVRHQRRAHLSTVLVCQQCSAQFTSRLDLRHHCQRLHDGAAVAKCRQCRRGFTNIRRLKRHYKLHQATVKPTV